jgi:hypothetical protein
VSNPRVYAHADECQACGGGLRRCLHFPSSLFPNPLSLARRSRATGVISCPARVSTIQDSLCRRNVQTGAAFIESGRTRLGAALECLMDCLPVSQVRPARQVPNKSSVLAGSLPSLPSNYNLGVPMASPATMRSPTNRTFCGVIVTTRTA